MATATSRIQCIRCGKERRTFRCEGCDQAFCAIDLPIHQQELSAQLDQLEYDRDLLQQTLSQKTEKFREHALMKQIDQWEERSIRIIRQQADQYRQTLVEYLNKHHHGCERNLAELTDQMKNLRRENDFNETDLDDLKRKLKKLSDGLDLVCHISVASQQHAIPLVENISIVISSEYEQSSGTRNLEPSTLQAEENISPHADPQLVKLLKSVNDQGTSVTDSEIMAYIREHMNPNKKFYIRNIVLSYLEACLIIRNSRKKQIGENIAKQRMTILNAVIKHKPEAELQAVYAIQNFVHKLKHPPKMARLLFDIFFDEECVSEDVFLQWRDNPVLSETEGHAAVEMAVKDFFIWLQQAETEVEEEET